MARSSVLLVLTGLAVVLAQTNDMGSVSPSSTPGLYAASTTTFTSPTWIPTTAPPTNTSDFGQKISAYYLIPVLPGLVLGFLGFYLIGTTIFLAGLVLAGGAFYAFSPALFPTTKFCCSEHDPIWGRLLIAAILGLLGGLLAYRFFRVGIFMVGSCFGLLAALIMLTSPLGAYPFFDGNAGVLCFYLGCMLVGGILTMIFRKFFVVLTTALAGSLLVMLGVDYFVQSHFGRLMLYLGHRLALSVREKLEHDTMPAPDDKDFGSSALIMLLAWFLFGVVCFVCQYLIGHRTASKTYHRVFLVDVPTNGSGVSIQERANIEMEQRQSLLPRSTSDSVI